MANGEWRMANLERERISREIVSLTVRFLLFCLVEVRGKNVH